MVKTATKQLANGCEWLLLDWLNRSPAVSGALMAVLGVLLLLFSLIWMVKMLRRLVFSRVRALFGRVLFRNGLISFVLGILLTVMVQSSSVTTSLAVPLVGRPRSCGG
jgi:sodium-dependent phosphate cotransporter